MSIFNQDRAWRGLFGVLLWPNCVGNDLEQIRIDLGYMAEVSGAPIRVDKLNPELSEAMRLKFAGNIHFAKSVRLECQTCGHGWVWRHPCAGLALTVDFNYAKTKCPACHTDVEWPEMPPPPLLVAPPCAREEIGEMIKALPIRQPAIILSGDRHDSFSAIANIRPDEN